MNLYVFMVYSYDIYLVWVGKKWYMVREIIFVRVFGFEYFKIIYLYKNEL